jgi:hypothetical protein
MEIQSFILCAGITPTAGERFLQFTGTVPLELPAPGDYRLDITADEEGRPFVYAYNMEAMEKPE